MKQFLTFIYIQLHILATHTKKKGWGDEGKLAGEMFCDKIFPQM